MLFWVKTVRGRLVLYGNMQVIFLVANDLYEAEKVCEQTMVSRITYERNDNFPEALSNDHFQNTQETTVSKKIKK